jgi:hypothetical protein
MFHPTPTFTVLFCAVSLALHAPIVDAIPLPVNQMTFKTQGQGMYSKQPFQGYRQESPQNFNPIRPVMTVRGSFQAAKVKKTLQDRSPPVADDLGGEYPIKTLTSASVYAASDKPSSGWVSCFMAQYTYE